jgi:GNAT superfamily N-acetyltransferase
MIAEDATMHAPLGYCASRDRYLKRDELGVIYQLCVAPGVQRKLVGASLIKAVFERSAYGCRLYCCWCAQDLAANYFWESLGFVPIAFRAGRWRWRTVAPCRC